MSASLFDPSEAKDNGTRLARLLIDGGTHVLRELLHSMFPPATLPTVLNKFKPSLQNLKSRRKLFDDQWELLYPSSGQAPDANKFDITLLHLLLREICALTEPSNGWHNMPAEDDDSQEAHIVRIKCFRNDLCHNISTGVPNDEFEETWTTVSQSLEALGLDPEEIKRLKNETIDHDTKRRIEEVMKYDWEPRVSSLEHDIEKLKGQFSSPANNQAAFDSEERSSCLPDEVRQVFGRTEEIQVATQAILGGKVSVVEITGAPGFGKTTVANKVAHELAKPENNTTVFYCSLRTKSTLNDVTTSMFLACSASQSQPPENPHNWLLNWSKQRSRYATFILDNADSIIEHSRDFVGMMQEMRTLSRQKVSFVVTSRKTIPMRQSHLDKEEVRVGCLSQEEAERLLLSKVSSEEKRKTLTLTKKLVELCACVPMALCIVGSLLSDYNEARLVASLKKEPLEVMESDEMSLKNAIQTSFDFLTPEEQKALAIMSVFPGSFDSDAAEAVFAAGTNINSEAQLMRILRSLKNRSLLEHTSSERYQVHQFIQAFSNMICKNTFPDIFNDLEKVACNYFVRLLSENAVRHYTKDKCMESIEAFNKDRHNFEHFLQVFAKVMSERPGFIDPVLESSSKMFFDQLPQKCRYLEMCLLPSVYGKTLEKLLCHFDTEPVHKVELLCLLSTEKRKVGNQREYFDRFEQAKRDYRQNYTAFRTNGLSQVLFFNSYARFLFEKWGSAIDPFKEVQNIALCLCLTKIPDHPERAATVLEIGKSKKDILYLQEATAFFSERLGEHFLTAHGHKAIADVYFSSGNLETAIFHYENALAIMEKCGMSGNKESIMALKNYAMCHRQKGDLEDALAILEKAKQIAEVELEDDHRWKAMIDAARALVYEDRGNEEEAKASMRNALEMSKRLGLEIKRLGNPREIRCFMDRYPSVNPR
ncbi:uncharacterized protein LOC114963303 [Acropora millepora]|uniref:uncharacterized protein LOC114963303 n=1 Tax=Acropora millepora TaxID=45264 RepID=UPI001CF10D39|nr:uncharacterized protein LOC114963303 [Acropora millepora]